MCQDLGGRKYREVRTDFFASTKQASKQVSNEFITRERPGEGIRGADSGTATKCLTNM